MSAEIQQNDKIYFRFIVGVSIAIPVLVALLIYLPKGSGTLGFDVYLLPKINAMINSAVTLLLVAGYLFIRRRNIRAHQLSMATAFVLSALFLVSYVVYHYYTEETHFGGTGFSRTLYFFILLTHILLSAAIVPLVLITIYRSTSGQFEKHRRIARWTLPLWLYVSITGVIVYLMISPYYPH